MSTRPSNSSVPPVVVPGTWDGPSAQDQIIHDPLALLRDKYFDGGTVLSMEFDLYPARRAIDPGWANRLEAADLAVTITMNSRVVYKDIDAVFANRALIERALARIPSDAELATSNLNDPELRDALSTLFRSFRVPGVSIAKATKVLCLKRAKLIPMLDDWVRQELYDTDMPALSDDPGEFAALALAEMELFRRIMLWPTGNGRTNLDGLLYLSEELSREAGERFPDLCTNPPLALTPVRVLDNLLWFWHAGYQQFGWEWDEAARWFVKLG